MKLLFNLVIKHPHKFSFFLSLIALLIFMNIAHNIRFTGYDQSPETNFLDEYTNVWHGLSIRTSGVPAAWSDLRSYWDFKPDLENSFQSSKAGLAIKGFNITFDQVMPAFFPKRNFPELAIYTTEFKFGMETKYTSLMQPYLDHPPFGAVVLSLLVPQSQDNFYKLTPFGSRKTSTWLADLTTLLIFLFAYQLFKNPIIALISAGIYASAPTFLFTSRMALLENVLIPMQLLSLNLLLLAREKATSKLVAYRVILVLSGLAAGLSFLSKTPGFAVIIAGVIILFLYKERFKNILFFLMPALILSSVYFIWGMILAPDIFPKLLVEQSTKRIFVGSLNFITASFKFGWQGFPIDGWWFGGFLSLIFLKFNKQFYPLIVSLLLTLFIILFTGASAFPWYFIPLIPFLVLATANLFWEVAVSPTISKILIFFLIFFSSSYFWSQGVYSASPNFTQHEQQFVIYKILLLLSFAASIFGPLLYKRSLIFRILWFSSIVILVLILIRWNFQSIFYMLQHWGKLIENYSPNWKL